MSQFRFAFLIMARDHDPARDRALISTPSCLSRIVGVSSLEEACRVAVQLVRSGEVDHIELCGAFGREGAQRVKAALGGTAAVGYMTYLE